MFEMRLNESFIMLNLNIHHKHDLVMKFGEQQRCGLQV